MTETNNKTGSAAPRAQNVGQPRYCFESDVNAIFNYKLADAYYASIRGRLTDAEVRELDSFSDKATAYFVQVRRSEMPEIEQGLLAIWKRFLPDIPAHLALFCAFDLCERIGIEKIY